MVSVDPFTVSKFFFFRSAKARVTVSLVVPIFCAISSCVKLRVTLMGLFSDLWSAIRSSRNPASFSSAECDSPMARISEIAEW